MGGPHDTWEMPLPSILPERCARIPLHQSIRSGWAGSLKQFPTKGFHALYNCNVFFPSSRAKQLGGEGNSNTITWKKKECRGELQRRDPSLRDRSTCSGCHILYIHHKSKTEMSSAHNIYCYVCCTFLFCFQGALSHANFRLGLSQKPLAGFQIITIMHGFKSFCFGIKSHSFADFQQMFCTLRRKMAAQ